jgi:hypothetical protein
VWVDRNFPVSLSNDCSLDAGHAQAVSIFGGVQLNDCLPDHPMEVGSRDDYCESDHNREGLVGSSQ